MLCSRNVQRLEIENGKWKVDFVKLVLSPNNATSKEEISVIYMRDFRELGEERRLKH